MDDAMKAERLLERSFLPHHQKELRGLDSAGLLDVSFVGLLRAVNGVLALRRTIANSGDSIRQAHDRAEKYKKRSRELKTRENVIGGRLMEAEVDRDTWQQKCHEAEGKAAAALAELSTAQAQLATTEVRLTTAQGFLEEAGSRIGELARQLREADARADSAACDAYAAEAKAEDALRKAAEADARAEEAMAQVGAAEAAAMDASLRAAEAKKEAQEAKARAAGGEERAPAFSRGDLPFEDRVKAEVRRYLESAEHQAEVADAASDAYFKGFEYCKGKAAALYGPEGLDALQPSDDEEADEGGVGESSKSPDH